MSKRKLEEIVFKGDKFGEVTVVEVRTNFLLIEYPTNYNKDGVMGTTMVRYLIHKEEFLNKYFPEDKAIEDKAMSYDEMKAYCVEHEIDIKGIKKKVDIQKAIDDYNEQLQDKDKQLEPDNEPLQDEKTKLQYEKDALRLDEDALQSAHQALQKLKDEKNKQEKGDTKDEDNKTDMNSDKGVIV